MILPGEQTPVLGSDVAPALEPANWGVSNADATHIVTWQGGGGFRFQSDTTTPALAVFATNRLVVGKTYEFIITVSSYVGGALKTDALIGSPAFTGSVGTHRVIGVCQSPSIQLTRSTTNVDLTISSIQVREILSYSDTINGFRTGNWTDSVGSIPATIDGKTGLVIDAAGSVGDNVAPALEAANWSVIGNDATHIVTWQTGGGFRYQSDTTSPTLMVSKSGILTPGKTYELILNCSSYVSGSLKIDATTIGAIQLASSAGISRCVFTATASTLTLYRNTTNVDLTVSSLQVRELTGIHALQATDGFKPVERRGLVNLLTYSNDFSNAVWSKTEATFSGGKLIPSTNATVHYFNNPAASISGDKTIAALVSLDGSSVNKVTLYPGGGATFANFNVGSMTCAGEANVSSVSITDYGDGKVLLLATYPSSVTNDRLRIYASSGTIGAALTAGDGTSGIYLHSAALFQGTVTAQQIIDAGGIPVTTTEPKSSSLGPRYLQFEDARATRMLLSKQPFDFMGDWCVVFAASCDRNDSVVDAVFANCYSVNNDGMYMGFFQGKPILSLKTGAVTSLLQPTTLAVDTPVVVSARKIGNTVQLRVNSVLVGETTKVWTTPTAPDTFSIGSIGSNYFLNGKLHALGYSGGTYSDAELLLLEKFAGKLAGVQI